MANISFESGKNTDENLLKIHQAFVESFNKCTTNKNKNITEVSLWKRMKLNNLDVQTPKKELEKLVKANIITQNSITKLFQQD